MTVLPKESSRLQLWWTGDGAVPSVSFTVTGTPQAVGGSGQRMFCTDQTGVIHYDPPAPAARPASLVLQ